MCLQTNQDHRFQADQGLVVWSTHQSSHDFSHHRTADYPTKRSRVRFKRTEQLRCEINFRLKSLTNPTNVEGHQTGMMCLLRVTVESLALTLTNSALILTKPIICHVSEQERRCSGTENHEHHRLTHLTIC